MGIFRKKKAVISDTAQLEELLQLEHKLTKVASGLNKRSFWKKVQELVPWVAECDECYYVYNASKHVMIIKEGRYKGSI